MPFKLVVDHLLGAMDQEAWEGGGGIKPLLGED
jgi:hypothetical protein